MVQSGKETNPGPSKEQCNNEDIFWDDEGTDEVLDMKTFHESNEVLKTSKLKCDICGVGDIVKVNNKKKHELLVSGKGGIRKASYKEYRCNFRNKDKNCRAGYYHGYTTYQ